MIQKTYSLVALLLVFNACKTENSNTRNSIPIEQQYLGQTTPGFTPIVFAPDKISTDNWEFGGAFTPDLKEYYFIREIALTNEKKVMKFMVYQYRNNQWKDSIISSNIGRPTIAPDGKTMHFGKKYKERNETGNWSELKQLSPLLDTIRIMQLSASANKTYVFDAMGEGVIRYSKLVEGKRESPILFDKQINSGKANAHPFIAPDESYMLWDGRKKEGFGKSDIYASFKQKDGLWGKAINLGNQINTPASENAPRVSPDGKFLFFNRSVGKVKPTDKYEDVNIFWVDAKIIHRLNPYL